MEDAGSLALDRPPALAAQPRRKVRKGTESCWECKRRKTRCAFASPGHVICQGCRRRGTACISQELPEQHVPAGSNRHIVDRLGHVEALVKHLAMAVDQKNLQGDVGPRLSPSADDGPRLRRGVVAQDPPDSDARPNRRKRGTSTHPERERSSLSEPASELSQPNTATGSETPSKYGDLSRELLAAWPCEADLAVILSMPVETSSIIRAVTCTQTADSVGEAPPSPQVMLQLPPSGSHPVLIARKLLILGTFLQGLDHDSASGLEYLSSSCSDIMSNVVKKAHNLVTSDDDLVASTEGIECILLESLYENYAGNLRRSWLAARRAVMIAQMLGLHRGAKPVSLTGASFRPDYIWFRLVQHDRYLSFMLGLPQSSSDDYFAGPELLEPCIAVERMQRLNCVAAGRIMRRSTADMFDLAATKDIDELLQYASTSMPPQWWIAPNLASCTGHMERIRETLRFMDQFTHYNLLTQLHLPYLLQFSDDRKREYNTMAAISASREVLSRFVSFSAFNQLGYCRGVDLLAFESSTALCLAHIRDRGRIQNKQTGFPFLAHQRLSDRGLMERALDLMEEAGGQGSDRIASKVATLLHHLLAIEADATSGGRYSVESSLGSFDGGDGEGLGCDVRLDDDRKVLSISIPYSWVIKVECVSSQAELSPRSHAQDSVVPTKYPPLLAALQGGNKVASGDGLDHSLESPNWEEFSSQQLVSPSQDGITDNFQLASAHDSQFMPPSHGTDTDDWGLQDVDMTFFEGFIRGT